MKSEHLTPKQRQASARLLQHYCDKYGKGDYNDIADRIGVHFNTFKGWRTEKYDIPTHQLGPILKTLDLPYRNALILASAIRPDLNSRWLSNKIQQKDWEVLSHPAFDRQWLQGQPAKDRAGLLLRAWRLKSGLTLRELEKNSGLSHSTLGYMETGQQAITLGDYAMIAPALDAQLNIGGKIGFTQDDHNYFRKCCEVSEGKRRHSIRAESTQAAVLNPSATQKATKLIRHEKSGGREKS